MNSGLRSGPSDRLIIHRLTRASDSGTFAEDVRAGLTLRPKRLPPKYFYDDLGSMLFEAICRLPEYYLTRAESEILRNYADEIVSLIKGPARLVELGSGSADKTRFLLESLLTRQQQLHYLPVDISDVSLQRSSEELLHAYPGLRITAYAADYFTALQALTAAANQQQSERTMVLFLGSNIGNFDAGESRKFLREVRKMLQDGDELLLGADLKKSIDVLVPAYDDALGITSAFNRNLLVRINRELDGDFDVKKFEHKTIYNDGPGRIEIHLVSREPQSVRLRAINLQVDFEQGESIHTENSYKFDLEQLAQLARDTGFSLDRTWLDNQGRFSFNLFTAQPF